MADTPEFKLIGQGDDGLVVLENSTGMAWKIYKIIRLCSPSKRALINDQAYREFKALKIIGRHTNFIELRSSKVEFFDGEMLKNRLSNSPYIKMSFIDNLFDLRETARLWGFEPNKSPYINKPVMNFEKRNQIVKHILRQAFDVLSILEYNKIRHRDLDDVNVKIEFPQMTLKVMDFARADVPDWTGFNVTENPDLIVKTAKEEMKNGSKDSIWKDCIDAYKNPVNEHYRDDSLPPGVDYTDKMAMKSIISHALTIHVQYDFKWAGFHTQEDVLNENLTLLTMVHSIWGKKNQEVDKLLGSPTINEANRFMRENKDTCLRVIECSKTMFEHLVREDQAFLVGAHDLSQNFMCDRLITHSSDYLARAFEADPLSL